jgi:hypothetical protein
MLMAQNNAITSDMIDCAVAAAYRGHYNLAEWFAAASDDPGLARRLCAEVAAIRGDYDVAERFRKKINGTK